MPKPLDESTVASLKAQYPGVPLETIELDYVDEPIVLKPPSAEAYRVFRDSSELSIDDRLKIIGQLNVVYPPLEKLNEIGEARVAMWAIIGDQVLEMAGIHEKVARKKL